MNARNVEKATRTDRPSLATRSLVAFVVINIAICTAMLIQVRAVEGGPGRLTKHRPRSRDRERGRRDRRRRSRSDERGGRRDRI